MKNIEKQLLILEKETRNLELKRYTYYKKVGYDFIFDEKLNTEYSSSREDFEKCKEKYIVQYPCETSLREIEDKKTNKIIGYAKESIIKFEHTEKFKLLFNDAFKELCEKLNVSDKESFLYYIENYNEGEDFLTTEMLFNLRIKSLIEIYEKYNKYEEFKKFLNKVIF